MQPIQLSGLWNKIKILFATKKHFTPKNVKLPIWPFNVWKKCNPSLVQLNKQSKRKRWWGIWKGGKGWSLKNETKNRGNEGNKKEGCRGDCYAANRHPNLAAYRKIGIVSKFRKIKKVEKMIDQIIDQNIIAKQNFVWFCFILQIFLIIFCRFPSLKIINSFSIIGALKGEYLTIEF